MANRKINISSFWLIGITLFLGASPAFAAYQFTPTGGQLVTGNEMPIRSEGAAATTGMNVGSWKGTLADDSFHWRASTTASGIDMNLVFDNFQLNGANKLIVETDIVVATTTTNLLLEICDFVSTSSVDHAADARCTGGGWRYLNSRTVNNTPYFYNDTAGAGDVLQWSIYDGYWTTNSTSGIPIATPLSNFVNNGQMRMRYFASSTPLGNLSVDYLRVNAIVDPIYSAAGFNKNSGGTVTGIYPNTQIFGNVVGGIMSNTAGDGILLSVPGTAATTSDFYLTFDNVKAYNGMNTILVATEAYCSAATQNLQYQFAIRNFTGSTWENISQPIDCLAASPMNYFAKNSATIGDYISSSSEIWIRDYGLSTSTTSLVIDSIYLTLGSTPTSTDVSFGTSTAGRLVINGSVGEDRPAYIAEDGTYMYVGGFGSNGGDRRWRLEKRNLSDGALVTAFASSGVAISDPSITNDEINSVVLAGDSVFTVGYASSTNDSIWYLEKRNATTGLLDSNFGVSGATSSNPSVRLDRATGMTTDGNYLYIVGTDFSSSAANSSWRIEKRATSTGALVAAFGVNGTTSSNPGTGLDTPYTVNVIGNDLYVAGSASSTTMLNTGWRVEKRDATTGAFVGTFATSGVLESNPTTLVDEIYSMTNDGNFLYFAGYASSTLNGGTGRARLEKRATSTGALVTAFDTDGIVEMNHTAATGEIWQSVRTDATGVYLAGVDSLTIGTVGRLRIDKYDITTGVATTTFDGDGHVAAEEGSEDQFMALAVDGGNLYAVGYGSSTPSGTKWIIEKRNATTGLLSTSTPTFGNSYPTSTWNINTTGDTNSWNLLAEDESANMGTGNDYYPLNTDANATIGEAVAANFNFGVTVPSGAAVTSLYYAARFAPGASSTMQVGIRDYSGLSGALGGWTAWGAAQTLAMSYQDAVTIGGVGVSGLHGFTTNPEDYVDTVNNRMSMNIRTTVDAPTSTNFSPNIDFMMATFQWTGATSYVPPVSGVKTLTLSDHIVGQQTNQFDINETQVTSSTLFRYKLTSSSGSISITATTITISAQSGFESADITNAKLYLDSNANGIVDIEDSQLGSNGTTTITNGTGSIFFGNNWTVATTSQVLLQLNVINIGYADYLNLLLHTENITTTDSKTGFVTGVNHAKPFRYFGGGGDDGFEGAPPVTGTLLGGEIDGGDSGNPGGGTVSGGGADGGGGEAP